MARSHGIGRGQELGTRLTTDRLVIAKAGAGICTLRCSSVYGTRSNFHHRKICFNDHKTILEKCTSKC